MARVKATYRRRSQGPPTPSNLYWTADMSDKRQATDDIGGSQSKRTCPPLPAAVAAAASPLAAASPVAAGGSPLAAASPVAAGGSPLAAVAGSEQAHFSPDHRYFMQVYVLNIPWNPKGEQEAWMQMDQDHCHVRFDMLSGINFYFYKDDFKVVPYGPKMPAITNANMCAFDVPAGCCVRWQYDHMFHHQYDSTKRAFMIVKLPIHNPDSPPYTKHDSPAIDAVMRQKFRMLGLPNLTTPCWFPLPQAERQRDYWKALYEGKKRAHDKLLKDYNDLDEKQFALEKDLEEAQAELTLHTVALDKIDKALECAICFQRFSSTGPSVMASCGHVVHTGCKKNLEDKQSANDCAECRAPVAYWQDFRGFTDISEAVTTLHTALAPAQ